MYALSRKIWIIKIAERVDVLYANTEYIKSKLNFLFFLPFFSNLKNICLILNVIFVIPMMCLVGIDSKIAEKTIFNFHSFWRFPLLYRSRGAIRWKTNVIFVIPMLCLVGIDIKIIKILIFFARTPTRRLLQLRLQQQKTATAAVEW